MLCLTLVDKKYILSGCSDGSIKKWVLPLADSDSNQIFAGHTDAVWQIIQLNENQAASGSADKTIFVWDLPSGLSLFRLLGHEDKIMKGLVALDKDYILSASLDKTCKVWNLQK